jgi:transposase
MARTTRELAQIAKRLSDTELRAGALRDQLDAALFYWHEDRGLSIAELTRETGISRPTVYKSIERYRSRASRA